ncbi:MAG: hypothetical protein ACTHJM_15480 [Marmoricola sp.]
MTKSSMSGLTVRWSLAGASDDTAARLAEYVEQTSHERFEGKEGLRFKTWRMRPGEWFEGCYVFESDSARAQFQDEFTKVAAESPGSVIVGASPILIEPCMVPAIARGGSGFVSAPSYDA